MSCPGCCASEDWASSCGRKVGLDAWLPGPVGNRPGLQARYPAGSVQEATDQSMFLLHIDVFLPLSLPSPL